MSDEHNGGPAFPHEFASEPGMSLRDWFAGQALAGIVSDHKIGASAPDGARWAYEYADAMLAERGKE